MNPEQENFQALRRLLALKRHEQPPPGYFDNFSSQVIARIQEAEENASWLERLVAEAPWLGQLWAALSAKPALAGGFALAICGLLVAGVIFSEDTNTPTVAVLPTPNSANVPTQMAAQPASPILDHATPLGISSTAGVLPQQSSPSIFQEFKDLRDSQRPIFQAVNQSYVIQGGN